MSSGSWPRVAETWTNRAAPCFGRTCARRAPKKWRYFTPSVVGKARSAFVVLDTAPTGHTLLLMDATGAYHRQILRDLEPRLTGAGRVHTPLKRLQDPDYTHVIMVALPETTPVSEAAALQEDLRRAHIEPWAWVVNRSLLAAGARDPFLRQRLEGELRQIERIRDALAQRVFILPWQANPPVGLAALRRLTA